MPDIEWFDSPRTLKCRVCRETGVGALIAVASIVGRPTIEAVKCSECGSIDLLAESGPSSASDREVDHYIEIGAGIATIGDALALVDPQRVRRFLDVGCGYGFSLDVGRALHGWDVRGVEPSLAALRGAAELGVDIRHEFLNDQSDVGTGFDLIFASEVIEHVPDPRIFLGAIRERLGRRGCIVLTTPAAEAISPEFPASDALSALSPGFHTFLTSVKGMEILLRDAGFRHVSVARRHANIRVIASVRGRRWDDFTAHTAVDRLDDYYAAATNKAQRGSALHVGMAVRHLRSIVAQGKFHKADDAAQFVSDSFEARYGFLIEDPEGTREHLANSEPIASIAGAAFALGMLELIHRANAHKAVSYFELAGVNARRTLDVLDPTDLDSVDIIAQSAYHRALALARFDGAAAAAAWDELREIRPLVSATSELWLSIGVVRIFVEMVAHSTESDAPETFFAAVASHATKLAQSVEFDASIAGLDGLYSLGLAASRSGKTIESLRWLRACTDECVKRRSDDFHAQQLLGLCKALIPKNSQSRDEGLPLHYMIDQYWCDASGTFLQGWVHCENESIDSITVSLGETTVVASRHDREDLLNFWPDCAEVVHSGFRVYLPCAPSGDPTIYVSTATGIGARRLELPDHQLPPPAPILGNDEGHERIMDYIAQAPDGPVLAIGVRSATAEDAQAQRILFENREVIGFDIHPGHGVDVVGDAHELAAMFPEGHFAIVYSASVLEHVAAPWIVAAQCARVTMTGGINVHQTPWTWPAHSQPNDFWRFSTAGLSQLFSPNLGFELLSAMEMGSMAVIPQGALREGHLGMPVLYSAAGNWIVAEKVNDSAGDVAWPYSAEVGAALAKAYPVDGLAKGGQTP